MTVRFYTEREFPAELSRMGGYGDAGTDIVNGLRAVSPWDFLTGIFVDKPKAEAAAQLQAQQTAAAAFEAQQAQRQQTLRVVLIAGAGLVGVLALAIALKPPSRPVAGYRKGKRRRR